MPPCGGARSKPRVELRLRSLRIPHHFERSSEFCKLRWSACPAAVVWRDRSSRLVLVGLHDGVSFRLTLRDEPSDRPSSQPVGLWHGRMLDMTTAQRNWAYPNSALGMFGTSLV